MTLFKKCSWINLACYIFIVMGLFTIFQIGGGYILSNEFPKKDIYGQNCTLGNFSDDWECPADSAEFKRLKSEDCSLKGYIQISKDSDNLYSYECANGNKYVLKTNYYGLKGVKKQA